MSTNKQFLLMYHRHKFLDLFDKRIIYLNYCAIIEEKAIYSGSFSKTIHQD
jgi:hypothetical protein